MWTDQRKYTQQLRFEAQNNQIKSAQKFDQVTKQHVSIFCNQTEYWILMCDTHPHHPASLIVEYKHYYACQARKAIYFLLSCVIVQCVAAISALI